MTSTRNQRISQLLFAWLAVSAFILSTACSNPGSPSHPTTPPQDKTVSTQSHHSHKHHAPKAVVNTPAGQNLPVIHNRLASDDDLNTESGMSSQEAADHQNADTSDITDNTPAQAARLNGTKGLTPEQLFAEPAGSARLSAQNNELFYGASSSDGLYEQIQKMQSKVKSESQREANIRFAKRIVFSTFNIVGAKRARVSVSILNSKGLAARRDFSGTLDRDLHMRAVSGPFVLDAVCMDATGGCRTVHIRIQEKGAHPAIAHVLARNTDATLYIQGTPIGSVNNPEYDRLMQIMLNTIHDSGGPESVSTLRLITSETINGPSKFAVTFGLSLESRRSEQVLSWSGALVKPKRSNRVNVVLKPVFGIADGNIANTVREARMVRNDGRGDVQITLAVRRGTAAAAEGVLRLTISRVQTPVRELVLN